MKTTPNTQESLFADAASAAAGDEARLVEKLRRIEALFAGATTEGEQAAADAARQRIRQRLDALLTEDPPVEVRFTMADHWQRKLLLALLRRYGVEPYRYRRQRHTTVMMRVPRRFLDETLWPQFEELSKTLTTYLAEVTDRVIAQVLQASGDEAHVADDPPQLRPAASATRPEPSRQATPASSATNSRAREASPAAPASSRKPDASKRNRRRKDRKKRKRRRR